MSERQRNGILDLEQFAAQDRVCGMRLNPQYTIHRAFFDLGTYHFCSEKCQKEFEGNPNRYADRSR